MAISTRWFFMTIQYGTRASRRVGGEILKLCVKVGGSISGEHGVGADKRLYAKYVYWVDLETMQWVHGAFNPKGLANPGKIFPRRTCGEAAMAQVQKQFESVDGFR